MQIYQQAMSKYNNATPEQRGYLSVGLTLGLLIILVLLIFPAVNHILALNKEISEGKKIEKQLVDKIIALDQAEINYTELQERLSIIDEALPTGTAVDDHLKQLQKISSKNRAPLTGIQFSEVPLSPPQDNQNLIVSEIEYSSAVKGTFTNIERFLTDLENLIRTVDVSTISISEDGSSLSASFKSTIYYLGKRVVRSTQPTGDNQSSRNNPETVGEVP